MQLKLRTKLGGLAAGVVALAGAVFGLGGSASAFVNPPPYSPNSNPAVLSASTYCYHNAAIDNDFCYRWIRFGGGYMQGSEQQWLGEQALTAVTCAIGRVVGTDHNGLGHWNWIDSSSGNPSRPFCLAGSPTAFWNRSQGASG